MGKKKYAIPKHQFAQTHSFSVIIKLIVYILNISGEKSKVLESVYNVQYSVMKKTQARKNHISFCNAFLFYWHKGKDNERAFH